LLGRSPALGMDALITFSDVNGLQLWFRGEGNCSECDLADQCKATLIREAKFRGIELPENFDEVQPTLIADMLFEVIMRD